MSTKATKASRPVTDQARPVPYGGFKAIAGSLVPGSTFTARTDSWTATATRPPKAIYQVCEKAVEAQRQIERLKSLTVLYNNEAVCDDNLDNLQSIATSVSLLGSFLSSPIPIPVASRNSDCGSSLFFDEDGFYGDLEIKGDFVEYFIKSSRNDAELEIFDTEKVESGFIPPRLLTVLFSHYAR